MNKIIALLSIILVTLFTGCTNVRTIGNINGLDVTRVTTRGVFSPSSTTVVLSDPTKPGTIESIDAAHGPGFVPAVANAAGIAGGAALLRPSSVKQSGGGASASNYSVNNSTSAAAGGTATGGAGGTANAAGGGGNTQNGAVHHNSGNGNGNGGN